MIKDTSALTYDILQRLVSLASQGLLVFFVAVIVIAGYNVRKLFLDIHGWSHRFMGACHLSLLVYGTLSSSYHPFIYDLALGISGILTTLSAARDFPHKYVRNAPGQSGTLSETAMVTHAEMIEHAFYQFLNLCQAMYLHALYLLPGNIATRLAAIILVTAPWWTRSLFPVHSFSHNWQKTPVERRTTIEVWLYRIKKMQYIFYKHVILHGINIAQATNPSDFVNRRPWRLFWIALNTSYVMEFFLNSLVRRKVISQSIMLALNRLLMLVSSILALPIVTNLISVPICAASVYLNFTRRYHDVQNTFLLACVSVLLTYYDMSPV